jgi:hypothetical protein
MEKSSLAYRFIALCMAALVFLSTAGITVDFHYCKGELKSFSFFGKAKPCHEPSLKQCPFHKKMMVKSNDKKGCCENKTVHFQSDSEQKVQAYNFNLEQTLQKLITPFGIVYSPEISFEKEISSFVRYKPPLIPRDISVLFQSFLL